jgi:hypothetical protein
MQFEDFAIIPILYKNENDKELAIDSDVYGLTAVLEAETLTEIFLYRLEAILSFIEHKNVIILSPFMGTYENYISQLNYKKFSWNRKNAGGSVIGEDIFFKNSRKDFIQKAMNKLQDTEFCQNTSFNVLFFKCVESIRSNFLDIQYFLLFSGLESFARDFSNNQNIKTDNNTSNHIWRCLQFYGFQVYNNSDDLKRSISSYTCIRNELFHNSKIEANINLNGKINQFKLIDYFPHLRRLVSLVIIKATEFDDDHINWDSWIDFQPYK